MNLPPLNEFIDLIKATDEDAEYRLPLVEQAGPILYAGVEGSEDEREVLAEKFERWRYQRLNKFAPNFSANEQQLVALLDVAVCKLLNNSRPPKTTRFAIASLAESQAVFKAAFDSQSPLDVVTARAAAITAEHFTPTNARRQFWRMKLYAPIYLSNHCINHCLYCGFRFPNQIERVHLSLEQVLADAAFLRQQGHQHLLIVAGDFPRLTSIDYLTEIVKELAQREFEISVEVAPQSTVAYRKLVRAGATAVTLYQETYQEHIYNRLHPRGPKIWFDWRLESLERAADAGMKRVGLGILLGLADPLIDLRSLIRHGRYLRERFREINLAFSLPRIHEAPDNFTPDYTIDDETFIRLYCALRSSFPAADLVLSTREAPALRDQLAKICITQMSAGSCTAPGGYSALACSSQAGEQFPVFDHRTPSEIQTCLEQSGFQVEWNSTSKSIDRVDASSD